MSHKRLDLLSQRLREFDCTEHISKKKIYKYKKYIFMPDVLPQCANVSSRRVDLPSLRDETVAFSSLPSPLRPTTSFQSVRENDFEFVDLSSTSRTTSYQVVMVRPDVACSSCRCPGKTRGAPSVSLWPSRTATKHRQCAKINAAPETSSCSKPMVARSPINSKAKTDAPHMAATTPLTTQCTARINLSTSTAPILVVHAANTCLHDVLGTIGISSQLSEGTDWNSLCQRCVRHLRFELLGPFDLFPLPLFNPCERQSQPTFRTPTRLGPFRSFGRS